MRRIVTIDCLYGGPEQAAAYLLMAGDEAAFVDNNTAHAVPLLLRALRDHGYRPEQVRYVIITHVHLDHAGGTSALLEACPRATVLAHPRAAKHVIDPSRLIASARQVYGEGEFARLYGEIHPIDVARVVAVEHEARHELGGEHLRFFHTRGHANHHFCIEDAAAGAVFTGDAFGLRYPALQQAGLFVFPSTSPTDFDGPEAKKSVDAILACGLTAYPTHFGAVHETQRAAEQLKALLDFSEALMQEAARSGLPDPELTGFCKERLRPELERSAARVGLTLGADEWRLLQLDLDLNAQGLAHAAQKLRRPRA